MNEIVKNIIDDVKNAVLNDNPNANVGKTDRIISVGTGTYIFFKGITNLFSSPLLALTEVSIGGGLLYRGLTGVCPVKNLIEDEAEQPYQNSAVQGYRTASVAQL